MVEINTYLDYRQAMGKLFASKRKACGLSQRELALRCGWDKSNLQRIEWGKNNLTLKTFLILCTVLGCSPSELLAELEKQQTINIFQEFQ